MKIRCAKCGVDPEAFVWKDGALEYNGGLKMKSGRLLCAACARPSAVPHHRKAYLAELALRVDEAGGRR